ncbi:MAG: DMT family transporter [Actinomycetota bacterium]|jgi:drug/metabolite transporter (DMT)-like permease|nr:DMT family transporter [Actinomycetota bacterium]
MDVLVIALGLGSALLLAVGFAVQQRTAEQMPRSHRLEPRLLLDLVHRPVWLAGIAAMVGGQLLGAAALGHGELTLVEPLMASNVLFALPLAAAWHKRRLGRREWLGAIVLIAGLAVFVLAADPGASRRTLVPAALWVEALVPIFLVVSGFVALGRRHPDPARQATLLAAGAGTLYGLQDALTQRTLQLGFTLTMLETWQPYLLVAVVGLLLAQSAYQTAPLSASQPAMAIAEPITGIALGAGLLAQGLRLGPLPLAFELVGIAGMVTGLLLCAGSPVVAARAV